MGATRSKAKMPRIDGNRLEAWNGRLRGGCVQRIIIDRDTDCGEARLCSRNISQLYTIRNGRSRGEENYGAPHVVPHMKQLYMAHVARRVGNYCGR